MHIYLYIIIGASVCNEKSWGWGLSFPQVAFLNGIIPFVLVTPYMYFLKEKYYKKTSTELELGLQKNIEKIHNYQNINENNNDDNVKINLIHSELDIDNVSISKNENNFGDQNMKESNLENNDASENITINQQLTMVRTYANPFANFFFEISNFPALISLLNKK
jgi:hypothetical protein